MTSKEKLVKHALKHPELHAPAELTFFRLWLKSLKAPKAAEKNEEQG